MSSPGFRFGNLDKETTEGWDQLSAFEKVTRFNDAVEIQQEHFCQPLWEKHMKLTNAEVTGPKTARLTFEFTVPKFYTNTMDNLHGGAQATIYDIATTLALIPIAEPGFWFLGGVSRILSVTYLRPAPVGEKLIVETEVVHAGKTLASLRGTMKRARDGALISTCEHDKASTEVGKKPKL